MANKATAFVVGYSVVLIGLFGLFCYLVGSISPEPLAPVVIDGNLTSKNNKSRRAIFYEDYPGENETEEDETSRGNISLCIESLRNRGFVNFADVVEVRPPIIPSLLRKATMQRPVSLVNSNKVKGVRRSIKEMETNSTREERNSAVILKIMDDSGRSRVDINLGPNSSIEGNRLHYIMIRPDNKSEAENSSYANDYTRNEDKLRANTVIKILPNNTLVFEEINHSLVSLNVAKENTLNHNEDYQMNRANSNNNVNQSFTHENAANYEGINLMGKSDGPKNDSSNDPTQNDTETYSFKMLNDNDTKSINQLVENTDDVSYSVHKQFIRSDFDKKENTTARVE